MASINYMYQVGEPVWPIDPTIPALYAGVIEKITIEQFKDSSNITTELVKYKIRIESIGQSKVFIESNVHDTQNDGLTALAAIVDNNLCS